MEVEIDEIEGRCSGVVDMKVLHIASCRECSLNWDTGLFRAHGSVGLVDCGISRIIVLC